MGAEVVETSKKKRRGLMVFIWVGLGGVALLVAAVVVIGLYYT